METYEEKYKEAIERLKQWDKEHPNGGYAIQERDEFIFPELAESEDERVKKAIFGMVYDSDNELWSSYDVSKSDVLAWLEKQGENPSFNDPKYLAGFDTGREVQKIFDEQNPAEWSEDDEENLYHVDALIKDSSLEVRRQEYLSNWLKSLKDRVLPQLKQEWSEEDETIINRILAICSDFVKLYKVSPASTKVVQKDVDEIEAWLKSLRPQKQWKPTEEHYELEEFAKIVRCNLTGISKAVQELFEAKYLQLTGNKMYGGFKD